MSISAGILALARRICAELALPEISGLHLPELSAADAYRDEFGFVFLSDGSAAPFYVSLPGTLEPLHRRFPRPGDARLSLQDCLDGLAATSLPERALALGAWNALGQHLMRRAGYRCPPRGGESVQPRPGERIGMVGYFCPIIDRLVERGVDVLVVEQQPGRVPRREHVELSQDPAALAQCRLVYCTASTLINDSLQQVLDNCAGAEAVDLIGPSGSGLPDVLFEHGIHAVGGVSFDDAEALRAALARRESWGSVGAKYELTGDNYPGADALIEAASGGGKDRATVNLYQVSERPKR
jgi:uncharacterized protein (DUF4213/DUF364 family)